MRATKIWLLVLLLACLPACERKAPGPEECTAFARQYYLLSDDEPLKARALEDELNELTLKCLTTPFDRALITCAARTGQARACLARFADRRRRFP